MKLIYTNYELNEQINSILKKLHLSMNGITSDKMEKYGMKYEKNYGLSIVSIREIASYYKPDFDLSTRLWQISVRETKILATLLMPSEKFTEQLAEKWIDEIDNIELAEQITMNLFSKLSFAFHLAKKLIYCETETFKQIAGFLLIARIYNELTDNDTQDIMEQLFICMSTEKLQVAKSIITCLSRLSRRNVVTADRIYQKVCEYNIENKKNIYQQYIINEVKEEILFLKNYYN